jgi:hypothetical protein
VHHVAKYKEVFKLKFLFKVAIVRSHQFLSIQHLEDTGLNTRSLMGMSRQLKFVSHEGMTFEVKRQKLKICTENEVFVLDLKPGLMEQ